MTDKTGTRTLQLPHPLVPENVSLGKVLETRHSIRKFSDEPLSQEDLATLLWAGYGVRDDGRRTVPSAVAFYGLQLFVVVGEVRRIDSGIYSWNPQTNGLNLMSSGDLRFQLQKATSGQEVVADAPATLVFAASEKYGERFGDRGEAFAANEVGFSVQNTLLTAVALGLGAVPVGGFSASEVADSLGIQGSGKPYLLVPVGHPA
ncbi:SagB/ThcOx family dehydrogenase [Actinomycetaceae bacterium MB13-C1-2]|nr:SagB/ThcOx family dehydrogenase [Actinomycetaceae bacterium MB13-C1-2]